MIGGAYCEYRGMNPMLDYGRVYLVTFDYDENEQGGGLPLTANIRTDQGTGSRMHKKYKDMIHFLSEWVETNREDFAG